MSSIKNKEDKIKKSSHRAAEANFKKWVQLTHNFFSQFNSMGEYRVEASGSWSAWIAKHTYLTSNHHIIVMILGVWYVCFDFMA